MRTFILFAIAAAAIIWASVLDWRAVLLMLVASWADRLIRSQQESRNAE